MPERIPTVATGAGGEGRREYGTCEGAKAREHNEGANTWKQATEGDAACVLHRLVSMYEETLPKDSLSLLRGQLF